MKGEYFYVPLATAISPINGEALCDHWWSVHPERGICFYFQATGYARSEEPSPQCNPNEGNARRLNAQFKPDHEVQFLPVVFMGHAQKEMHRIRRERAAKAHTP